MGSHNSCRPVEQIDFNDNVINTFKSVKHAGVYIGSSTPTICDCIAGRRNSVKGFKWRFKETLIEGEEWLKHPIHNIHVSNMGRIKNSIGRKTFGSNRNNYKSVGVDKKNKLIHRLVMETFDPIGEIISLYMSNHIPHVDHLDGNPHNNKLENLEWVTPEENNKRKNNK